MTELVRGSLVPLFDRLSVAGAGLGTTQHLLSPEQLQNSIGRELARLLNTRSAINVADFSNCTATSIDYGLPDIGHLSPHSRSDLDLLEQTVKRAIEYFEPRLTNVRVQAVTGGVMNTRPVVAISGLVSIGMKLRQLNFELQLDASQTRQEKVI